MKLAGSIVTTTMKLLDKKGTRDLITLNRSNRGEKVSYLAFGSNLSPMRISESCRAPNAQFVARYVLEGWALGMGGENRVATLMPDPKGRAAAVLYSITRRELRNLDNCEGLHLDCGIYWRHEVKLGDETKAFTYLMQEKDWKPGELPKCSYYLVVKRGLEFWGFEEQLRDFKGRGYDKG